MEPQIKLESRVLTCLGSLTVGIDGFRRFWIPPRQQLQAFSNEPFSFVSTKVMSHHMPPEGRFSKRIPPPRTKKEESRNKTQPNQGIGNPFRTNYIRYYASPGFCPKKTSHGEVWSNWSQVWTSKSSSITCAWKQAPFSTRARMKSKNFELRWGWIGGLVFYMPLVWLIYLDLLGCMNILFSVTKGGHSRWFGSCLLYLVIILDFQQLVFMLFFTTILLVIHVWHHAEMEHHESKKINPGVDHVPRETPPSLCRSQHPCDSKKSENTKSAPDVLPRVPDLCLDFAWMILRRHTSVLIRTRLQEAPICTIWRYDGRRGDKYKKGPLRKMLEYKGLLLPMFANKTCRNL